MSTDISLSKTQISKIIKSRESFGYWLANFGNKALTNVAISLARNNLPGLVISLTSSAINKLDRKISGKGALRAGKEFILFISNEDTNDIIRIKKSLEDSGVLIIGVTETVKHETKYEVAFLGFVSNFSSITSTTSNFLSSKMYKWELEDQEENIWMKIFSSPPSFKKYQDYQLFQIWT